MCEIYKCQSCGKAHAAIEFADNQGQCPSCGHQVTVDRSAKTKKAA